MKVKSNLPAFYRERLDHVLMQLLTRDLSGPERSFLRDQAKHWQKKINEVQDANEDHAR